ncbi:MAG TPA: hypothetical protein VL096_03430, partial [Pirellulaceae bacterium]|nr:hypothetical protein [Pirellulaceae bacterium]
SAAGQAGSQTLAVATPVGQLSAILPAVDRFACALERLTLESPRLANASIDDLKQLSNALTQRLSYLLEPISLLESDASSATVQLRSNPPAKDDDQTSYYEIVARKGGSIELCRYVKQSGQPREVTAAHLTHEVVARLSQDFVDAVA